MTTPDEKRSAKDVAEAVLNSAKGMTFSDFVEADKWWRSKISEALTQYGNARLEEAAKVAEAIYGTQFHDKTEVRTGRKIALNIRALKGAPRP